MAASLDELLANEKEKYQKQREDAHAKLEEADRYLAAIAAFEAAKEGKPVLQLAELAPVKRRGPAPGTSRSRDGSGRDKVLDLIRSNPTTGIKSGDIEAQLPDIKGIPNILTKLAKEGLIQQSARRQPYFPITPGAVEEDLGEPT